MIALVLQARMGSNRYPGKMLADIAGKTLLERVMIRHEHILGGPQYLAIPDTPESDSMVPIAEARGWKFHRGSESDVLRRYADTIRHFDLQLVIRATGDNPLVDPDCVRKVAKLLPAYDVVHPTAFPHGTAVEGATAAALLAADEEAREPREREHVMPWLYSHEARFRTAKFDSAWKSLNHLRVTVDTAEDIEQARRTFEKFGDHPDLGEVFAWLGGSR